MFHTPPHKLDGRVASDGMNDYTAVGIAEGFVEAKDEGDTLRAWQHLVDTGLAWRLQGWFGRQAKAMIESGDIAPPKTGWENSY